MRLIRFKEVLDRTGHSRSVVYDLMAVGEFPRPVKMYRGGRTNLWSDEEIDAYVKALLAEREAA